MIIEIINYNSLKLPEKLVVFGQSCSGKTTFSKLLTTHKYFCFDSLFPWNDIETLGLSTSVALDNISELLSKEDNFILDGWHLSDSEMKQLPEGSVICVVYCDYYQIIDQYRVPVAHRDQHINMFTKWYIDIKYPPTSVFVENTGKDFFIRSFDDYITFLK